MKTIVRSALFAVLLLGGAAAHAQATVTVVRTNGSTSTIGVAENGGVTFAGDYVIITESAGGNTQSFPMAAVRKLLFGTNGIADVANATQLALYPNPAHDYCVVSGIGEERQSVTVYTATGSKVIETTVGDGERLDLSALQKGFYIVRINGVATKLSKW
ncbi:MAG: T9SS type A sorting domain-containing protein [Bacteroidales bacterium]|nr:T9SS type A sorting domain-containing protein [Bacteroidales bacterium]